MNLYKPSLFDVEELHNFLGLPQNIHSSGDSTLILIKRCVYKVESIVWCRLALSYFPGLENLSPTEFSFVVCKLECTGISLQRPRHVTEVDRPHKNKSVYFCIGTFKMLNLFSQLLTVRTRHSFSVACSPELCVACMDYEGL